MRDPQRIDKILYELGKLWVRHPDYRFYQMLINYGIIPEHREDRLWFIEDYKVLKFLKKINKLK